MVIDLHGYSMPIARAAVRSALHMLREEAVSQGTSLESKYPIDNTDLSVAETQVAQSDSNRPAVNIPAAASANSKQQSKKMGTLIFPESPPKKEPSTASSSARLVLRGRRSLVIITGV